MCAKFGFRRDGELGKEAFLSRGFLAKHCAHHNLLKL